MMITAERTKRIGLMAAADAGLLALACLLPTLSHALSLPLYMANPMLAMLLGGMLIGRRSGLTTLNGLLLAVLMPVVASLLTGMPEGGKVVCMAAELAVVALVFDALRDSMRPMAAVLLAIMSAKVVYYVLKAVIVAPATLVGTDWMVQAAAVLLWAGLFALVYKRGAR